MLRAFLEQIESDEIADEAYRSRDYALLRTSLTRPGYNGC